MKLGLVVTGERTDQTDRWMKGFKERHLTDDSRKVSWRDLNSKSKTPKQSSDVRQMDPSQTGHHQFKGHPNHHHNGLYCNINTPSIPRSKVQQYNRLYRQNQMRI